jgi:hypothetical protein
MKRVTSYSFSDNAWHLLQWTFGVECIPTALSRVADGACVLTYIDVAIPAIAGLVALPWPHALLRSFPCPKCPRVPPKLWFGRRSRGSCRIRAPQVRSTRAMQRPTTSAPGPSPARASTIQPSPITPRLSSSTRRTLRTTIAATFLSPRATMTAPSRTTAKQSRSMRSTSPPAIVSHSAGNSSVWPEGACFLFPRKIQVCSRSR